MAESPDFDTLAIGEQVIERTLDFNRDRLVRYAGASGDFNPIHYRDDVAQSVGLPGVLAHGMLTMGAAGSVATDWLGGSGWVQDFQARFTRPIPVAADENTHVTVSATIGAIDVDERTVRLDLKVVFDGQTVLGKAQLVAVFL